MPQEMRHVMLPPDRARCIFIWCIEAASLLLHGKLQLWTWPPQLPLGSCSQVPAASDKAHFVFLSISKARTFSVLTSGISRIAARHAGAGWGIQFSPPDVQIHEELLCFVLFPISCLCWRSIQSWLDFCPTLGRALNTLVAPAGPQKDWFWLQVIKTGIFKQVSELLPVTGFGVCVWGGDCIIVEQVRILPGINLAKGSY